MNAQEFASFVTLHGLYTYKVLLFGLRNASATFQSMINHFIAGLEGVCAYIDDIVVFSNTWEKHMQLLEELFKTRCGKSHREAQIRVWQGVHDLFESCYRRGLHSI